MPDYHFHIDVYEEILTETLGRESSQLPILDPLDRHLQIACAVPIHRETQTLAWIHDDVLG